MPGKRIEFEPEIEEYLNLKKPGTAKAYRCGFTKFLEYYRGKYGADTNFRHFLLRIQAEFQKPLLEQGRIIETEISGFIDFLKDKGLSNNGIRLYFAAIQNYMKYKHVDVSMSFIDMPPPIAKRDDSNREVNKKHEWEIDHVRQFVEAATSYRDKALILCMFQSGLAVKEICNLKYGNVQDELEAGVLPICLDLVRQKTNVKFKTFFGRDAVKYLKLYLATRSNLKPNSPLFAQERLKNVKGKMKEVKLNPIIIEQSFANIASKLSFIKQNGGYNPARPHSLRAAFNSRLVGKIDQTLRELWMGHSIGGVAKAYLAMPTDEMRKLYMAAEEFLKIEQSSREELDEMAKSKDMATMILEGKVKELEQRIKMHENIFKQMIEMSFEEFAKWMQDKNRWEWQQQREADIQKAEQAWTEEDKKRIIDNP